MTNKNSLRRKLHMKAAVTVLMLALTQLSLPLGNKAMTTPTLEPPPVDTCIAQSFVKIDKVKYGTDDGKDIVHVEWSNHANSSCVLFGGGFDVPGQSNITPFGNEVTVKVKRRFGHEDSATVKGTIITDGNDKLSHNVTIPRDRLETDPISYEVKVRTTAGSVMSRTARLAGTGGPSLSAATQTSSTRSTVPNLLGTCFPTVQVSALNFLPGAGPKPDRVTINFAAGLAAAVAPCFDTPKVMIVVRVTRPNGVVDTGQANFDASGTTANISLPGTPGAVASFEVLVTATIGSVIEKVSTSSGLF